MNKLSYAIGMSLGQNMVGSGIKEINYEDFLNGVKVIFEQGEPEISVQQGNQLLKTYFEKIQKEKEAAEKLERERNLKKSEEYLTENAKNDDVLTTKSGLQYTVLGIGQNPLTPSAHSRVRVHYEGRLTNGTVFDSSYKRGEPAEFNLDQVIAGWAEGLQLMREGSTYEFTIPPQLGYGEVGVPGHIPGNTVLIFKVELLKIVE